MKPQFPTVQEQIEYWNTKERLEHERVMDIRAESRDVPNETRSDCPNCDQWQNWTPFGYYDCFHGCAERGFVPKRPTPGASPQIPNGNASDMAKTLTQEEIEERQQATCEIYDERERNYSDGRTDGYGESYAERQV